MVSDATCLCSLLLWPREAYAEGKEEEVLTNLYGQDVFAWFPTGYGKSLFIASVVDG